VVDRSRPTVDAPFEAGPRCDPTGAFGPPELIASLSTDLDDTTPRLSPDELDIVFSRRTGTLYDLWTARRPSIEEPFGPAMLLTSVNSVNNEVWPTLSPDGLVLMFDADRTMPGTYRMWSSSRTSTTAPFGPPSPRAELMPGELHSALPTDRALYFASGARPGLGASDIWRADINESGIIAVPVALVGGVNTAADEITPAVTADERQIFFRRTTGTAPDLQDDIYTSSRSTAQDGWGPSAPVPSLAVAGISETPGWVSPDGCNLYLYAAIAGGPMGANIYVAKRAVGI
jgi:Tol biopolymer transport system component